MANITISAASLVTAPAVSCGEGAFWDEATGRCLHKNELYPYPFQKGGARELVDKNASTVEILGIIDTNRFDWAPELSKFTVSSINDHRDGWFDNVLEDGTFLNWSIRNEACNPDVAMNEYWDYRTNYPGYPPHGIVGCRCSEASLAVARLANFDGVPQISPASTTPQLSDKKRFPYFARTVGPTEVSGAVAMLRGFGWKRVTVIQTDDVYASNFFTEFQNQWVGYHNDASGEWEGEIPYSPTISLNNDDTVNEESVRKALENAPTDNPEVNSRIIFLISHNQHAFPILRIAEDTSFQTDSIWVGTAGWIGRYPVDGDTETIPEFPRYIGLTPYRNRDSHYHSFLERFNNERQLQGKDPWDEFPDYAAEHLVDSILALAMGISATAQGHRRNVTKIMPNILRAGFDGVSGYVSFTEEGDRQDDLYNILNFYQGRWIDVGVVGAQIGTADFNLDAICLVEGICGFVPKDSYPVEPEPLPKWIIPVVSAVASVLILVTACYLYTTYKKKQIESQMTEMQKKIAALNNIDNELVDIDQVMEEAKKRQALLITKRAELLETPETWTNSLQTLVSVPPESEEYWGVLNKIRETIPDAHISYLWRVQNPSLWSYYSFHKERFGKMGISANERRVWHGTRTLDPTVIYNDEMDGFMMQFANQGFWGRGIYFADKASYSKSYSHKPAHYDEDNKGRPKAKKDELEMFLARLLVGKDVLLSQDGNLRVPPEDKSTGQRYHTVTGYTAGSQVWIVYENGRAYPEYLVRYYCGKRSDDRSPYESMNEARKSKSWRKSAFELKEESGSDGRKSGTNVRQGLWKYLGDEGWVAYEPMHQTMIEKTYQDFVNKKSNNSVVIIKGPVWQYEVNVGAMMQTNIDISSRTQRKVCFEAS